MLRERERKSLPGLQECVCEKLGHVGRKSEARMSKPEANPNDHILQRQFASLTDVLSIWIFIMALASDFDVRISNFFRFCR
jgi:hypothetical protein